MTLPRTVADVLDRHVTFEIESIDRMYCNVYQPRLQYPKGAAAFFHFHRGHTFASSALMAPMTKAFVAEIHDFIAARGLDLINFTKGQRKDDLTQSYLADHDGSEAVLYVGRAQEKASVMRTERRYDQRTGASYAWLVKASALVNHFYFYCFDDDFGPFFIKFCSYFPYNAKLCINGHEWAKRQAAKKGIGFTALDNGFAAVDDPAKVQAVCDRLGPTQIDALLRKWLRRLPHPFTRMDRIAGPLRNLGTAGRVLPDPDARQADHREDLLRAGDSGQPRPGSPRPGRARLRPAHPRRTKATHSRGVPHPGHQLRRHAEPARGLQARHHQAVPQGRRRAAH